MPGCLTPDRDSRRVGGRRRHRESLSGDHAWAPATSRTCARRCLHVKLMPTGGVTLDNAGDWIKAGAVAVGVGSALVDAAADRGGRTITSTRGHARRIVANVQAARESPDGRQSRDVRRDHAAAQPAGVRAAAAVAVARRHVRRRRGERRGQPGAVRARQLVRDAAAEESDRRRGDPRAAGRRRAHRRHRPRRRSRRDLLRRERRQPARLGRGLRPRALGHQRDGAGDRRLADGIQRGGVVPRDRHHARARAEGGGVHPEAACRGARRPARGSAST